ncbi:hypothetical protein B0H11DRAFT_1921664 [Mycena galericulata]|nr:hypothetical protein B0H11DRAFT_1921664 [Mycena galericulata]
MPVSSPGSTLDTPLRVDQSGAVVPRLLPTPPRPRQGGPLNPLLVDHTGAIVPVLLPTPPRARTRRRANENTRPRAPPINRGPASTPRPPARLTERERAQLRASVAERRRIYRQRAQAEARAAGAVDRSRHRPPRVRRGPLGTAAGRAAAALAGARVARDRPLTREQLWLNGIGPPEQTTDRKHQQCGICLQVKSHPVSYLCGHSHCYACVRVWLEQSWVCPLCTQIMWDAPHRNYIEEAGIACDFPDWHDTSIVSYSWDGLTFPRRPIIPDTP